MANTLTAIMPKILAKALLVLRERAVMPRLVNSDYSTDTAKKGSTIDVSVPSAVTTSNVVPSQVPPAGKNTVTATVQIVLDQWKQNDAIFLTDKDFQEVEERDILPGQLNEAIRALANDVNDHIMTEYKGIYGSYGVTTTIPFNSTDTVKHATQPRKVLNQQLCPREDRRMVMNFDAEASALALAQFADAEKTLSNQVKIEGEIGRKYGMDMVADDKVPTHTAGTITGTIVASGTNAIGASKVVLATDVSEAVDILKGDIVTFAGDTQQYVATVDSTIAASTTGDLNVSPDLLIAKSAGEALTMTHGSGNDYTVNLAFHRDAFAFATRPLQADPPGMTLGGSNVISMQDPVTGLVLRLEVSRQHKQIAWEFDILWGSKLVRPELACRVVGD